MSRISLFFITISLIFAMQACEKDPVVIDEEELITTLNYTLSPQDGSETITFIFQDLDGEGGDEPWLQAPALSANQTYTGTLTLLNESVTPIENVTTEIQEEDIEHQVFFLSNATDVNVSYLDQDPNGNPIGLSTTLVTGEATTGSLTLILRHQPDKNGSGVSTGNISNAGGETDIEVTFPINVQ